MTTHRRIQNFFLFLIVFALFLMSAPLWAQECRGHSCNGGEGVSTTVGGSTITNAIGGADSLALGFGGADFDVAIAGCVGSVASTYGFGAFGRQKLKEDHWCQAMSLIGAGYRDAGEFILCTETILKDMDDCPGSLAEKPSDATQDDSDMLGHAQAEEQHTEQLVASMAAISDLEQKISELSRPRNVSTVVKEEFLTDKKRAALEALRGE